MTSQHPSLGLLRTQIQQNAGLRSQIPRHSVEFVLLVAQVVDIRHPHQPRYDIVRSHALSGLLRSQIDKYRDFAVSKVSVSESVRRTLDEVNRVHPT